MTDVQLTAAARKVFVKNWFDISRLRVRTIRGVIHVQGRIAKLTGTPEEREGDETSMRKLDEDLHALAKMRGVCYQLDNWVSVSAGVWRKLHVKMTDAARAALAEGNDVG